MEEKRTTLPENAQRELKPGEKYEPLLSPQKTILKSHLIPCASDW